MTRLKRVAAISALLCWISADPLLAQWTQKLPANAPSARDALAMTFDAARGQVVLFGGRYGSGNDTWVWDGTNWTQKFPSNTPPPRSEHSMAYDAGHQEVILYGGWTGAISLGDTWAWNGENWVRKYPAHNPPPLDSHSMTFDASRRRGECPVDRRK